MTNHQPFYYSWTAQNDAVEFPVKHADGAHFVLDDGREIFDFISTSFQTNFGHSHSKIKQCISRQLEHMPIAAMLLLTLRGTPTLYNGDELAIPQRFIPAEQQLDPHGRNLPGSGRDGCRTPMQWDESFQAGFSPAGAEAPWLPLTDDWPDRNVAKHLENPRSLLNLYRALLAYRKSSAALQTGDYRQVDAVAGCLAYTRDRGALTIALNFTDTELDLGLSGTIAVTTYLDDAAVPTRLRPHEGLIIEN